MTSAEWETVEPGEGRPVFENRPEQVTLDECMAIARRWLGPSYDTESLLAVLAVAAVEQLDGDPVWLFVVSGSGNAKTETVQTLAHAGALVISSIASQGALLSATSKRERDVDATGGLLREVGARGILVLKDVTSILSMKYARDEVLAALREVYDGHWRRDVGTDGGRSLEWSGRLVVIGAVTTAWDSAREAVATMGDRFVLVRVDSGVDRLEAARQALANTGSESQMRVELGHAVAGVLAYVEPVAPTLTDAERERIMRVADLVTLARTGVERDRNGNAEWAHAPEAPTRLAKQLFQVMRGALAIGATRTQALHVAIRIGRDTMPPDRLAMLDYIAAHPASSNREVRDGLGLADRTAKRRMDDLQVLGLITYEEHTEAVGMTTRPVWRWSLRTGIDPSTLDLSDL